MGTVVSETVASNQGIGYLMMSAGSQMRMGLVFAGLLVISAMAMVMYELFAQLEKRMTGWAHRGRIAKPVWGLPTVEQRRAGGRIGAHIGVVRWL